MAQPSKVEIVKHEVNDGSNLCVSRGTNHGRALWMMPGNYGRVSPLDPARDIDQRTMKTSERDGG